MTVANTTSRNQYTATSGQTVFPYTFEIFDKGDVVVLKNGTALSEGTNYTVSGVGNDNGGNITLTVGATAGDILTIYRDMAYQRTTDYQTSGDFLAQEVNDDFDRLWLAAQQNEETNNRAITKPITDPASIDMTLPSATNRANSVLGFSATGAPIVGPSTTDVDTLVNIAADIATLADIEDGTVATDAISDTAAIASNITTVASNISNVNTVAGNTSNINTVAGNTTNINTVATNIADVTNFADVYLGGKASDPSTRNDGSALQAGDLYFNTTNDELRVYSGSIWQAGTAGTVSVQNFTGDGSDTTFVLASAPSGENNTQIYIDGVYQQKNTYSLSGSTITFSEAPPNLADIEVVTISTLALGQTDSSLTLYTPAGTGAVQTTVQSKLRETVSVKDFGAVGDGVTDDTAAIQAADASGAKSIYFPAGNYKVTSLINKALGVSWFSNGFMKGAQSPQQPAVTITVEGPTSGNFIDINGTTPTVGEANLSISGIAFAATGASKDLLVGIYSWIKVVKIENCSFTDFSTGIKVNNVENWILNNYFNSCAICIDLSGGECHISGNHGFPSSIAILCRTNANLIQNNKFFGDGANGDVGIEVWGKQNTIVNNVFDAFTDVGILLKANTADIESNTITGNVFSGIGNGGTYDSAIVLQALNGNIQDNTITANSISNNRGDRTTLYGIKGDVSTGRFIQRNAIVGNTITDCTTAPLVFSGSGTRQNNIYRSNVGQTGTANKTFGTVSGYNGLTVTHNLGATPDFVYVMPESSTVGAIAVDLITSTTFRLLMRDLTNAGIPSGSPITTRWVAESIDLP